MATYSCAHCGVERPWGFGHEINNSLDVKDLPLLNCEVCKTQTRHFFKEGNDYVVEFSLALERVVNVTFTRASRA
jgi:hypothetical protein